MALSLSNNQEKVPVADEKVIIDILVKLKDALDQLGRIEGLDLKLDDKYRHFIHLEYLTSLFTTKEIWAIAIGMGGYLLNDIPDNLKTSELCEMAIRNGADLSSVPQQLMTNEMCKTYFQTGSHRGGMMLRSELSDIPVKCRTPEVLFLAVKANYQHFRFLSDKSKTPELCLEAVKQSGSMLEYVPEELKTKEICQIALEKDEGAKKFFPKNSFDTMFENTESDDEYDENDYEKEDDEDYSRYDKKSDFEDKKGEHSEREERNVRDKNKKAVTADNYYCKWCGVLAHEVYRLTSDNCSRNPQGRKHELYEGGEKSQYTCKYCGVKFPTIESLTARPCSKSPHKKHHPAL